MMTSANPLRTRYPYWSLPLLALLAAILVWPHHVFGVGSRIPNQDPEAIARGNAFVATADNPSALYYNPAGITQLEGQNIQAGSLFYLKVDADYESPAGQRTENKRDIIAVPHLAYTISLKDLPLSFGLGVYSPFGLEMEWPDDAPFRNAGLKASLTYITLNPVVAWRPLPTLSLAIGPTFNYSEAKLRQGVIVSPYQLRVDGEDWAYGFNAGILWQPHPMWSFRPNTNWYIEVDTDWTDWDVVKNAVIQGIGTLTLNWQSSFFYEFGVTRQLGKGYFVSAGYFFSEASTPEKNYTPLVPDTDLHVGSLGLGRKGQHWTWALAGQIIGGAFRNVRGAADPSVNGRYRLFTPTVSFSIGYRF